MSSINSVVTPWKISGIDLIPNGALRKRYLQYGVLKHVSLLLSSSNFKCQNPEVASTFLMRPPLLKLKLIPESVREIFRKCGWVGE
jgi:hypothetical protein